MSLANGREYLAIPGPSVMPDRVLRAMHRAAPNIYEGDIVDEVAGISRDLKAVAKTRGELAIYIANGHGAWEAALANTHSRGETCLVLATGRFALGWSQHAAGLGLELDVMDFGKQSDVDLDALARHLAADADHRIKSVLVVQVDTATSVKNDIAGIRRVLDETGHPALLMVDCIASLACDRYEMDAWGVDVTVAGSQKGLMTPPGLSFVFFNDKAAAARETANCVTTYWDWRPRSHPEHFYQYFGGTAPTHHLFALREALAMIAEEGLEAIHTRHEVLARAVWAAFDAWGAEGPLRMNIADPAKRSTAVTALSIGAPYGNEIRKWVEANAGVTLGLGIGMVDRANPDSHGFFRIAHMGHVNAHMVLGALGAIEAGLTAIGVPHGSGALEAAARVCAGSSSG
ncbi:aminotransferase class V-fold PLP-dependent enzyme [Psychromarinibacter sp. C21-152]|uniref:Aminotransferase class V-fold PLP-dependent enzyme n=1 Tax=Psychromarinibacter sediminicola TaxID=3033385 RepID=A0AAE3T8C3_9RHOB|nr:aminotransferase class V-fold PLP-dependent enzyme [Psychromarinibacter sediminicola]MDF0599934.1 aminotransferase class V-fold PLP-dependent enzyme [Psychromarinibacter sediminicola]